MNHSLPLDCAGCSQGLGYAACEFFGGNTSGSIGLAVTNFSGFSCGTRQKLALRGSEKSEGGGIDMEIWIIMKNIIQNTIFANGARFTIEPQKHWAL